MNFSSASAIYFSPTGTTQKYVKKILSLLNLNEVKEYNLTYPKKRKISDTQIKDDLVVIGFPVYEEYAPKILLEVLDRFHFQSQPVICMAAYGKIGYGMSLQQMTDFLLKKGLKPVSMGAFIAEHSFATTRNPLAMNRPNASDLSDVQHLVDDFYRKMERHTYHLSKESVPGYLPLMARILPKNSAKLFTEPPIVNDKCTNCRLCIKKCPAGAIAHSLEIDASKCLRCFACAKKCRVKARDINYKKGIFVKMMFHKNEQMDKKNLVF